MFQAKNLRLKVGNSSPGSSTLSFEISDLYLGSRELILDSEIYEILTTKVRMEALNVCRLSFDDGAAQDVGGREALTIAGLECTMFSFRIS